MRQCIRCKSVKYWFQFYKIYYGYYSNQFDVCKKCANSLKEDAVIRYSKNQD